MKRRVTQRLSWPITLAPIPENIPCSKSRLLQFLPFPDSIENLWNNWPSVKQLGSGSDAKLLGVWSGIKLFEKILLQSWIAEKGLNCFQRWNKCSVVLKVFFKLFINQNNSSWHVGLSHNVQYMYIRSGAVLITLWPLECLSGMKQTDWIDPKSSYSISYILTSLPLKLCIF